MNNEERLQMHVEAVDRYLNEDLTRHRVERDDIDQERKDLEDIIAIEDRSEDVLYQRCLEKLQKADQAIENTKRAGKYSIEQVIKILKEKNRELAENYISKTAGQIQLEVNRLKTENQGLESDIIHKEQVIKKTQELIDKYIEIGDTERKTELEKKLEELKLEVNEKKEKYQINIEKLNTCENYEEQYKENSRMIKEYRDKAKLHEIELEEAEPVPTTPASTPVTPAPTRPVTTPASTPVTPAPTRPVTTPASTPVTPAPTRPVTTPASTPVTPAPTRPVTTPASTPVTPAPTRPVTTPVSTPITPAPTRPVTTPASTSVTPAPTTPDSKKIIINAETGYIIWDEMKSGTHYSEKIDLDKVFSDKDLRKSIINMLDKDKDKKYIKILKSRFRSIKLNPAILSILKEQGEIDDLKLYIDIVKDKDNGANDLPFEYEADLQGAYLTRNKTLNKLNTALLRDNKELGTQFPATKHLKLKRFLSKMPLLTKSTKSWIGLLPERNDKLKLGRITEDEQNLLKAKTYAEYMDKKYRNIENIEDHDFIMAQNELTNAKRALAKAEKGTPEAEEAARAVEAARKKLQAERDKMVRNDKGPRGTSKNLREAIRFTPTTPVSTPIAPVYAPTTPETER